MAVDPRQIVAAFLTVSMFAMLGNMIKNDHFSTAKEPEVQNVQFNVVKIEEASEVPTQDNKGPWAKSDLALKPCWEKPSPSEEDMSKGYVTFSLTSGPEYHVSQEAQTLQNNVSTYDSETFLALLGHVSENSNPRPIN